MTNSLLSSITKMHLDPLCQSMANIFYVEKVKTFMLGDFPHSEFTNHSQDSPTILKNILCLFLQDFVNLNGLANQKLCYIQMLLNIENSGE